MEKKKETILTRLGFCPKCFEAKRPMTGQLFIVHGGTSDKNKGKLARRMGRRGLVPHLYRLKKKFDKKVFYQKICCMEDCGVYVIYDEENRMDLITTDKEKWSGWIKTTFNNWNALQMFKDTGFEI